MSESSPRRGACVRVEHVRRAFEDGRVVLDDVSFSVASGELIGIAGRSGCGKTTLLQLVGGLDRPDAGEIWIDDLCLSRIRRPVDVRRHTLGFVFQLHYLLPALTAQANVELPLVAAGVARAERHALALSALDRVGLAGIARHRPEHLSGGERQRVALARAIVHRPRLLLADEPTGGLDRRAAHDVLALLAAMRGQDGTTVMVVSHDATLGGHADRLLLLQDGALREAAPETEAQPA